VVLFWFWIRRFYVPNFARNLISVSRLVPFGFSFNFIEFWFQYLQKILKLLVMVFCLIIYIVFIYKIDTTQNTMHVDTGLKRCIMNEESSIVMAPEIGTYLH